MPRYLKVVFAVAYLAAYSGGVVVGLTLPSHLTDPVDKALATGIGVVVATGATFVGCRCAAQFIRSGPPSPPIVSAWFHLALPNPTDPSAVAASGASLGSFLSEFRVAPDQLRIIVHAPEANGARERLCAYLQAVADAAYERKGERTREWARHRITDD